MDIENQGEKVAMPFSRFKECIINKDLLVDNRSIKAKWDIFVIKGVLTPLGNIPYDKALLNIPVFNELFHMRVDMTPAHAHTRTHTQVTTNSQEVLP